MTRLLWFWLAPVCAAFTLASASASVAPALTLEQQAQKADVVVRGSLGAPQSVTEGGITWRAYPLNMSEVVAGSTANMPQLDGSAAMYIWPNASNLPDWHTGQDAFFLLYQSRLDSPLVGFNQGYYAVTEGRVSVGEAKMTVDEFRRRVLAAREAGPTATRRATVTSTTSLPPPAQASQGGQ